MDKPDLDNSRVDNVIASMWVDAWRDGHDVQTLVDATQNPAFSATIARYNDLWLSTMLGN